MRQGSVKYHIVTVFQTFGFSSPGAGIFYNFFNCLWQSDKDNYINQVKYKKTKPEKGKKRDGDKILCDTDSTAAKLLPLMQRIHLPSNNPFFLIVQRGENEVCHDTYAEVISYNYEKSWRRTSERESTA